MNTPNQNHSTTLALPPATLRTEDGLEFWDNPHAKCPVAILCDVSSSMAGQALCELTAGLRTLLDEISRDELASLRIDLSILTFGETVEQPLPFGSSLIGITSEPPALTASGRTPLGEATRKAINAIEARRQVYRSSAIAAYAPWVVIFSDGQPTDEGWQEAAAQLKKLAQKNKWTVLCVGVGPQANLEILQMFSAFPVKRLDATQFRDVFFWLSDSLKVTSRSHTTDTTCVGLPAELPSLPTL